MTMKIEETCLSGFRIEVNSNAAVTYSLCFSVEFCHVGSDLERSAVRTQTGTKHAVITAISHLSNCVCFCRPLGA